MSKILLVFVMIMALSLPVFAQQDAFWLDVTGSSYEDECLTYCLQGIANREAPRLFLDTAAIFWSWPESDRYWMQYLTENKSFHFSRQASLRHTIEAFKSDIKGLALYDPAQDASRYLALTVAARQNLLPVTEEMLRYATPALTSAHWDFDDFSKPDLWHLAGTTTTRSTAGLEVREAHPTDGFGAVDRSVYIDLAVNPLIEVTVAQCAAQWVFKVNEGTAIDTQVQPETSQTGTFRYDLRNYLKRSEGCVKLRLFTVGEGSHTTYSKLQFLSAEGVPADALVINEPDCFTGLPVVEDFRNRFPDDLSAYRWSIDNLLPQCNKKLVFSAGHTHSDTWLGGDGAITIGLDYAIQQQAFVFNLSPAAVSFESYGHKDSTGFPEQAKLFDEIMQSLDSPAGVYGWSEPEYLYCERVSRGGNFVMCAGAPNLSFWAKVPAEGAFRLPQQAPRTKPLENKYYLLFQTNEGDTPKILAALQNGGWISPQRGSVPVAWGINPHIGEVFPALFEYYTKTATENDSFFAGCSGAGYTFPWRMPNLEDYAKQVGRCRDAFGPQLVDLWESNINIQGYETYRDIANVPAFTQQTIGSATNNWLDDGTPIITAERSLYYYNLEASDPSKFLANRIQAVAQAHEPPFFIIVYGGVGSGIYNLIINMQQKLPAENFEVIGADHFISLAREAGKLTVTPSQLGVSPGGVVNFEIILRNPDKDTAIPAGEVTWQLPEGWAKSASSWHHPAVAPGQIIRENIQLTAGSMAGRALITATDSSSAQTRTFRIEVYADTELIEDFTTINGWEQPSATLQVEGGKGTVATPGPYGCIRKRVEIDFDRGPILEAGALAVTGQWAIKINDGTLPVDPYVQSDTQMTGRLTYDLTQLEHKWTGKQWVDLIIFAVGDNSSVTLDELYLHYRK